MAWETEEIAVVKTEKVIDENPHTWIEAARVSIRKSDVQDAMEKLAQGRDFAHADKKALQEIETLTVICYYLARDFPAARRHKVAHEEEIRSCVWNDPDLVAMFYQQDPAPWQDLWEHSIKYMVEQGSYARLIQFDTLISPQLLASSVGNSFINDVIISKDQLALLKKIEAGGYPLTSYRDSNGRNLLMSALANGASDETVLFVLDKSINNVNNKSTGDETALLIAAKHGRNIQIVERLVEDGADIAARGPLGKTALHRFAKKRLRETPLEFLLQHGAPVNALDSNRNTPLHIAAMEGCADNVRILCAHGAALNAVNHEGNTPLYLAVMKSASVAVNLPGNPLYRFVEERGQTIKILCERGADVQFSQTDGTDALLLAILGGNDKILEILVKAGADINKYYPNSGGAVPLGILAAGSHWKTGFTECWKTLLRYGAKVDERDSDGWTPLMRSIDHSWTFSDELGMARALIDKGANAYAKGGCTSVDAILKHHNIKRSQFEQTGKTWFFEKWFD